MARIHYEIPDDVHRKAKAAAALRGETLKDFLIAALEQAAKDADSSAARRASGKRR